MSIISLGKTRKLPQQTHDEMEVYRDKGAHQVPSSYIEFHKDLADECVVQVCEDYDFSITAAEMVKDGWGDGMLVLRIEGETPSGKELVLQYKPDNQHFMKKMPSGGSSILFETDLD